MEGVPAQEFEVTLVDGPFAGRTAVVTTHLRAAPKYIYVLPDGGIVSPDLIMASDPAAHALAREAATYCRFTGDDDYRHFDFSDAPESCPPRAAP